jgi:hypothetical protein
VAIAIQDSSYVAYNSLVILQPLLKPIETIAVIVLSEQLKGHMHKIPVISRFYTQGCEDEKVIFSPGILQEDEVTKL